VAQKSAIRAYKHKNVYIPSEVSGRSLPFSESWKKKGRMSSGMFVTQAFILVHPVGAYFWRLKSSLADQSLFKSSYVSSYVRIATERILTCFAQETSVKIPQILFLMMNNYVSFFFEYAIMYIFPRFYVA